MPPALFFFLEIALGGWGRRLLWLFRSFVVAYKFLNWSICVKNAIGILLGFALILCVAFGMRTL